MNLKAPAKNRFLATVLPFAAASFVAGGTACAQAPSVSVTISPAGAPGLMLEVVGAATTDGAAVSIANPSSQPNQKWNLVPKGDGAYVIQPSYTPTLVLAAKGDARANRTPVVLQTETDQPTQLWTVQQNADGSVGLVLQGAPPKGLDDFGGAKTPGAPLDIWGYSPNSPHLQWKLQPVNGAALPSFSSNPAPASPAAAPAANVPHGTVKDFTMTDSAIFPGTTRKVSVFIPAQYDASKPACVYVQQDGFNPAMKDMLEQLIAADDMPVTVGVFITPGVLHQPGKNGGVRPNRGFEYDSINDNYVRFLNEEVLPYVAKTFQLNLSASGNDRCIVGASSGGIAAFNAAWLRPDLFSRVYSCSGSFSSFRDGNEFPTLVRKFEAKPIRAYLTAGTMDMENRAGDWFLLNQEMDKALKFSGYDYSFHIVDGKHVAGYKENFMEAMRFIWKGWPQPIPEGSSAPRVQDIIAPGQPWQLVPAGNFTDARSPVCNSKGEIFFVDARSNKIYRIGLDGQASVFLDDAAHADGLAIGPKDELYTVSSTTGDIMSYDAAGPGKVVTSGVPGRYVLARPDGSLYVTHADPASAKGSEVWLVKDGAKTLVDSGLKSATGLAYRPDQWLLAVADGGSKWVYSYQIGPDGHLTDKEPYYRLIVPDWEDDAGAGSVCFSTEGHILIATRWGVQICAADGPSQVVLPVPGNIRVDGIALGGSGMNTLFAFSGGKLWTRVVKVHAAGAFSPALPEPHGPL